MDPQYITVKGAKLHNLKNIDVQIPRNKLTVMTGVSGSGKSTLAFDTIYAEGQRRYVESLSTYARQFLQLMEKPDVESIDGLSPAISIDQKTAGRNPRSTVGTVTEIYDYLRLLFAKVGRPHCPSCNKPVSRQSASQIVEAIANMPDGKKVLLLAPVVKDRKGEHLKIIDKVKQDGFVRIRVDGEVYSVLEIPTLDENKKHSIEIVVDRLVIKDFKKRTQVLSNGEEIDVPNPDRTRLADSIETALQYGEGVIIIQDNDSKEEQTFSEHFACLDCGISISEVEPRSFSFNSPHGACNECHGLGVKQEIDPDMVIPNKNLTVNEGAIVPWSSSTTGMDWYNSILEAVSKKLGFSLDVPISKLKSEDLQAILFGTEDIKYKISLGTEGKTKFSGNYETHYEGVIPNLIRRYKETDSEYARSKIEGFMQEKVCETCNGRRLNPSALAVTIQDKNIIAVTDMSVIACSKFFGELSLTPTETEIAKMILHEIGSRLSFLQDVGLSYLTLSRAANTLSGGEAQRIRLATQIGSKLSGVLYVLDEPSIGLHQNDNAKLIKTLLELRDLGNTVIVVEHDIDTMMIADYILDIGPGAGKHGGSVVAHGTPQEVMDDENSITGGYLSGRKKIDIPKTRRTGNGKYLEVVNATEHNLTGVTVKFPLNTFISVTGVSGSGKSTLVNDILVQAVSKEINRGSKAQPGRHERVNGIQYLDKIINIDQSAIGRTPRSNPATYTGVFTDIRNMFAETPEAKLRGYKTGRFSFNVKGGRCEACSGDGIKKIEMHFLPDIYVPCEICTGKRYNSETLEVTYRGKNIADVLAMTVEDALEFFKAIPSVKTKLATLVDVGLGYICLGQSATTLSGGEAQRIKLATELAKRSTGSTLYILDEPTTGLHFEDIRKLLNVLQRLVDKGNTVITIEHNLDVVKCVDYIIDMGPEGGDKGGQVVAIGTPEEVMKVKNSYTGKWLKRVMEA
jgi:excinuclease ABC subunit A